VGATADLLAKVVSNKYSVLVYGPGADELFNKAHEAVGNGEPVFDGNVTVDQASEQTVLFIRNLEQVSFAVFVKLLERLSRNRSKFQLIAVTGSRRRIRMMFDGAFYNKFDHYFYTGGRHD